MIFINNISLSIITITYNDLEGLKKTIESIDCNNNLLKSNVDHIIIDGNSTDGTTNYINQVAPHRKITTKFISEPDLGIYDAMNKGITISTSDYVLFINSGDLILHNFFLPIVFERLFKNFNNTKYAGVAFGCLYNFSGNKYIVKARIISILNPRMPSLHQGIIYKRLVLVEIPYSLKFRICGDFDNICNIIKKYEFDIADINISELNAGGVSTFRPLLLAKESISIYKFHTKPNIFKILIYFLKISISLLTVQFLFYFTKLYLKIKSKF